MGNFPGACIDIAFEHFQLFIPTVDAHLHGATYRADIRPHRKIAPEPDSLIEPDVDVEGGLLRDDSGAAFEDGRDAVAAANAHCHQRIPPVGAPQFGNRLHGDDRARRTHRAAQ